MPTLAGAGAGFDVVQALRLSEAAANTAIAAILTNFMDIFPLLSSQIAGGD
jgi:hypothetical protein